MDDNIDIRSMDFPRTFNIRLWEMYLGRNLTSEETFIIENAKSEKSFNGELEQLHDVAVKKNLCVPFLTNMHGDCLFESLVYYKLFDSVETLRKSISYLMYIFKDYEYFFPEIKESLAETFPNINEIEHVFCSTDKTLYKYTYDVMCQDFASNNSWTRLPTQMVMMVISHLFNVQFIIISNLSTYEHVIDTNSQNIEPKKIYLGHIGESHYVPLMPISEIPDFNGRPPRYVDGKVRFYRWGINCWQELNSEPDNFNNHHNNNHHNNNHHNNHHNDLMRIHDEPASAMQTVDFSSYKPLDTDTTSQEVNYDN
jgi:hypothetical protein